MSRLKYYNSTTQQWEYGDECYSQNIVVSDTAPSNPNQNDLWEDTSTKILKYYDGTQWVKCHDIVTSISSSSTNNEIPSAKCVYDLMGNMESRIDSIRGTN